MNLFLDAIAWIFAPEQWTGRNAIGAALGVHLLFTAISVALAAVVAVPLGWLIGHTGRGREVAVIVSGAARAVPSFGLLILLVLLFGVLNRPEAAVVTFVLLAIPSILAGAYAGVEAIDPAVRDAGRAMGMTGWQVLWRIEAPLGLPLLVAGLRSATLQVVATVTIAAYVNLGGLGQYIIAGIPLRRYDMVLGGALLVIVLALLLDLVFAVLQRVAVPRGLRAGRSARTPTASRPTAPRAAPAPAAQP